MTFFLTRAEAWTKWKSNINNKNVEFLFWCERCYLSRGRTWLKRFPYFTSHETILNRFVRQSPIHKFSTAYERFFLPRKAKKVPYFPSTDFVGTLICKARKLANIWFVYNDTQSFCSAKSYTQIFNRQWRFFCWIFPSVLVPLCLSIFFIKNIHKFSSHRMVPFLNIVTNIFMIIILL